MTITSAMSIAVAVALAPTMSNSRPTMWRVVTVAKITASTALESPRINPRIFLFLFEKTLDKCARVWYNNSRKSGPWTEARYRISDRYTPYAKFFRLLAIFISPQIFPKTGGRSVHNIWQGGAQNLYSYCPACYLKCLARCLSRVCVRPDFHLTNLIKYVII